MKLYLVWGGGGGYDTYDSMVVCADSKEEAVTFHPNGEEIVKDGKWVNSYGHSGLINSTWVNADKIGELKVQEIGEANKNQDKDVILASFNAG